MTRRRRDPKFQRRILRLTASEATARTGNPRYWRFLLECGHVQHEHHSRRRAIHAVVMDGPVKPLLKVHCLKCAIGEPPNFDAFQIGDLRVLEGELQKKAYAHWKLALPQEGKKW